MSREAYWTIAIKDALDTLERKVSLSEDEYEKLGRALAGAAYMESEVLGYSMADLSPYAHHIRETQKLRQQLASERAKVTCTLCNGVGHTSNYYGTLQSSVRCYKCNGEGRHLP